MGVSWTAHKIKTEKLDKKVNSLLRQLGFLKTYDDGSAGIDHDKVERMPKYEADQANNVTAGLMWMNIAKDSGMSYGGLSNFIKQLKHVKAPAYLVDTLDTSEGFVEKNMCKMIASDLRKYGKRFSLELANCSAEEWTKSAEEIAVVFDAGAKYRGVDIH